MASRKWLSGLWGQQVLEVPVLLCCPPLPWVSRAAQSWGPGTEHGGPEGPSEAIRAVLTLPQGKLRPHGVELAQARQPVWTIGSGLPGL